VAGKHLPTSRLNRRVAVKNAIGLMLIVLFILIFTLARYAKNIPWSAR